MSLPFTDGSKYKPNNIATDGSGTWLAWRWSPSGRMLKSTNNGTSWSVITTDLPTYESGSKLLRYRQGTYGDGKFHIAAGGASYAIQAGGVFSSDNDGSNFDFNPLVGTAYGARGAVGVHHNGSDMVASSDNFHYKFN